MSTNVHGKMARVMLREEWPGSADDRQSGLRILARIIVHHHLKAEFTAVDQHDGGGSNEPEEDNNSKNKEGAE